MGVCVEPLLSEQERKEERSLVVFPPSFFHFFLSSRFLSFAFSLSLSPCPSLALSSWGRHKRRLATAGGESRPRLRPEGRAAAAASAEATGAKATRAATLSPPPSAPPLPPLTTRSPRCSEAAQQLLLHLLPPLLLLRLTPRGGKRPSLRCLRRFRRRQRCRSSLQVRRGRRGTTRCSSPRLPSTTRLPTPPTRS